MECNPLWGPSSCWASSRNCKWCHRFYKIQSGWGNREQNSKDLLTDAAKGGYDEAFNKELEAIFNGEVWHISWSREQFLAPEVSVVARTKFKYGFIIDGKFKFCLLRVDQGQCSNWCKWSWGQSGMVKNNGIVFIETHVWVLYTLFSWCVRRSKGRRVSR